MKTPQLVSESFLSSMGAKAKFGSSNKMSPGGNAAAKQQHLLSVPTFQGSFTFGGQTFPYTMVGNDPTHRGTTSVNTALISVSFFFDEFADQNGNNIVIDAAPIIPKVLNSPNFENASYGTGTTQFADAIQRAQFFATADDNWHTLIQNPRMLTPVQIEVPVGISQVFQTSDGTLFAAVSFEFFVSQLNTIIQLDPARVQELQIALTNNIVFFEGFNPTGLPGCCTIGFHTAFETGMQGPNVQVQTFATASYLSPEIFGIVFSDVVALSHEISEWMNDPFVNNIVPPWQNPDGSGTCGGNFLETGDPVEVLADPSFPVTVDGMTYHPQTEALLQWFSRKSPSDAFQHAYSYPDTHALTSPSVACK